MALKIDSPGPQFGRTHMRIHLLKLRRHLLKLPICNNGSNYVDVFDLDVKP